MNWGKARKENKKLKLLLTEALELVEIDYMNATTGATFYAGCFSDEVSELVADLCVAYLQSDSKSGVGITIKALTGEEN